MTRDDGEPPDGEELMTSDASSMLSWNENDGADADASGLEIDAGQAEEIKSIFLVTLPQYLEPVEQMIDQLFAEGAGAAAEGWQALAATLSSLSAAASRIGFEDIVIGLDRMAAMVRRAGGGAATGALRAELIDELGRIRQVATAGAEAAAAARLRELRGHRDRLARRVTAGQQAIAAQEQRIIELRRAQQAMADEEQSFDREVAGIVKRVERMLRTALREES